MTKQGQLIDVEGERRRTGPVIMLESYGQKDYGLARDMNNVLRWVYRVTLTVWTMIPDKEVPAYCLPSAVLEAVSRI